MALADARELEDVLSSKTVQLASAIGKELPAISDENEDEKSDERRDLPKILRTTGRRYFFSRRRSIPDVTDYVRIIVNLSARTTVERNQMARLCVLDEFDLIAPKAARKKPQGGYEKEKDFFFSKIAKTKLNEGARRM